MKDSLVGKLDITPWLVALLVWLVAVDETQFLLAPFSPS